MAEGRSGAAVFIWEDEEDVLDCSMLDWYWLTFMVDTSSQGFMKPKNKLLVALIMFSFCKSGALLFLYPELRVFIEFQIFVLSIELTF